MTFKFSFEWVKKGDVSRMKPQVTRIAVVVMNNVLSSSLGITLDILNTAADLMKAKGRANSSRAASRIWTPWRGFMPGLQLLRWPTD